MILILGSKGMLGGQLMKVFGSGAIGWDREDVDVTINENLRIKIKELNPSTVINCVAFNDVDGAEEKKDIAFKLNSEVPGNLAKICKELDIILVHYSTNYVFGEGPGRYNEVDTPNPNSVYSKSKYKGELEIQTNCEKFYIIRTAVLFGPKGESDMSKKSFVDIMLSLSEKQTEIKAISDEVNSITYAPDLARATQVLITQQFNFGIYHFTNSGQASWYEIAKEIFKIKNKDINLIPVPSTEFPRKAKRPVKSILLNNKFIEFRPWQEALEEFLTP